MRVTSTSQPMKKRRGRPRRQARRRRTSPVFFAENGVTAAAKEHMTVSELVAALDSHHPMLMCMQAWSSAVSGPEVSDFGRRTCFVTCAQKHEKAFMHYDN